MTLCRAFYQFVTRAVKASCRNSASGASGPLRAEQQSTEAALKVGPGQNRVLQRRKAALSHLDQMPSCSISHTQKIQVVANGPLLTVNYSSRIP
jgi:hypothetical protein